MNIQNVQLQLLNKEQNIIGAVVDSGSGPMLLTSFCLPGEDSAPPQTEKLKEGWYNTEKFGEVYVSPGGVGWVVQRQGDKLETVSVKLSKSDIVQKPSSERVKHAMAEKRRYKLSQGKQKGH
jgi:hypothetical protein